MLMSILDKVATTPIEDYNPADVIKAVNTLQPLGKDQAIAQITSARSAHNSQIPAYGLFWILRVLFDLPVGQGFPPVRIGQPTIPPPAQAGILPRFPITILLDIPFLVVRGYYMGGLPESVDAHVAYFRTHGTLRTELLAPALGENIEDPFVQLWNSAYAGAYTTEVLSTIKEQLVRLST
ncbi:MAG: hypothetical protein SH847_17520 [Roseiflexaceae bacterium]|nr:hypothetical protein [Roseiflexaceae bacterium]